MHLTKEERYIRRRLRQRENRPENSTVAVDLFADMACQYCHKAYWIAARGLILFKETALKEDGKASARITDIIETRLK